MIVYYIACSYADKGPSINNRLWIKRIYTMMTLKTKLVFSCSMIMQAFVAVLIKNGCDCSLYTFYVDDQGLSQKKNWGLYLGDCFEFAPNFLRVRFLNSTKFVCGV